MKKYLIVLLAALGAVSVSKAAPISGLGDPLINPALFGGTQETFESTVSGLYSSATWGDLTLQGVGAPFNVGTDYAGSYNNTGSKSVFNGFDYVPTAFKFSFANPVSAFGFNWGAADYTWTLSTYSSSNALLETISISPTHGSNSGEYFGASGSGISYATLTDSMNNIGSGDYVFIDRVTYQSGGGSSVPDSGSTVALLVLSIAGLVGIRRRFSRA